MVFVMEHNRGVTSKEPPRILPAPSRISDPLALAHVIFPLRRKVGFHLPHSRGSCKEAAWWGRGEDRTLLCAGIQQGRD